MLLGSTIINNLKECIPVGCEPSAAAAVGGGGVCPGGACPGGCLPRECVCPGGVSTPVHAGESG